jgi:hypothetical protein
VGEQHSQLEQPVRRLPASALTLEVAVKRDAPQRPGALLTRCLAVAVLAVTVLLPAACAAGSSTGQALAVGVVQEGAKYCAGAPSVPVNGIPAWNSPIGWAIDWYYNTSAASVEIESVSLIDSHNLVLHRAIVYEMRHSENPLIDVAGWELMGHYAVPSLWARRQNIPGAVIPPETSTIATPGPDARDEYEVVLDISAKTPAGGWAAGQQVTYRQGSTQYRVRAYTGYAVGPPGPPDGSGSPDCRTQWTAITAAWPHL